MINNFEKLYPKKELIFTLSNEEKLFIKQFDEGYIYYICNNNMPNGKYFTATYYKEGFRINFNEQFLKKEKVEKYFKRYTSKALEKLK